jgi:glycosyltransferase involved in cell wall biosynthesis
VAQDDPVMQRLRIAQVAPVWVPVPPYSGGGTEMIVHLLAEELVRRGCDVTLFAAGASRTAGRLRRLWPEAVVDMMAAGAAYEYDHYANANLVEALASSDAFDVVHSHLGFQQVPLGRLARTAYLHTVHITPSADDRWVLERCHDVAVTAVSHAQVAGVAPARRRSIRVIHHGIDFDAYAAGSGTGRYLLFLARMSPQKSPLDAIRIAERAGLPLVLAGAPQNAEERAYFEAEIAPRVDGRRVEWVGRVDQRRKQELLKEAAALLFPIQGDEAFGLAMIEAMACGTPVVAWRRASVPEIVEHGATGFHGTSVDELASFVERAMGLDRAAVRARARDRFHVTRMVDEYLAAYVDLLRPAPARVSP